MSNKYIQYIQAKAVIAGLAFVVYSTSFIQNEINYEKKHKGYQNISQLLMKQKEVKKELNKNRTFSLEDIDYAKIKKESLEEKADSISNELTKYSSQEILETTKRNNNFLMKGVCTYAFLIGYLLKSAAEITYFRKERYKELKEIRKSSF